MKTFRYEGEYTREISMPVGGIGAGCIGFAGNGGFTDWEIDGPFKGRINPFTHFALRAITKDGVSAKVLQGDHARDLTGTYARDKFAHRGFGYGPDSGTLAGFPHFESCTFEGAFPWAKAELSDPGFPGAVDITALRLAGDNNNFDVRKLLFDISCRIDAVGIHGGADIHQDYIHGVGAAENFGK